MRTAHDTTEAFTLVEMLVVLVLVGLLAGSMVVSLEGRAELYTLRAAAKDVAAAARFAASECRLSGRLHRLVIDKARSSFWVERLAVDGGNTFEPVRGQAGIPKPLAKGLGIEAVPSNGAPTAGSSGQLLLEFAAAGGFDGVIVVKSQDDQAAQIRIVSATGQVHIDD